MSNLRSESHRRAQIGRISQKIRDLGKQSPQIRPEVLERAINSLQWYTDRTLDVSDNPRVIIGLSYDGKHIDFRI